MTFSILTWSQMFWLTNLLLTLFWLILLFKTHQNLKSYIKFWIWSNKTSLSYIIGTAPISFWIQEYKIAEKGRKLNLSTLCGLRLNQVLKEDWRNIDIKYMSNHEKEKLMYFNESPFKVFFRNVKKCFLQTNKNERNLLEGRFK